MRDYSDRHTDKKEEPFLGEVLGGLIGFCGGAYFAFLALQPSLDSRLIDARAKLNQYKDHRDLPKFLRSKNLGGMTGAERKECNR